MRTLKRIPVTREGLEKFIQEMHDLREERKDAVIRLKTARDLGDLSENGLYKGARQNLTRIDGRIRQLDLMIKLADVQESEKGEIGLNAKVVIENDGKKRTFQIVGTYEADPLQNKISLSSPIGKALYGKKAGETAVLDLPTGKKHFKILSIS